MDRKRGSVQSLRYKGKGDSLKFNPYVRTTMVLELSLFIVSSLGTSLFFWSRDEFY